MTIQAMLYSVSTGFFFGLWPLIARMANLSTIWLSMMITIGTAVVVAVGITQEPNLPDIKSLLIGLMAGIVAGFGLLTYGKLITNSAQWDMSVTIPVSLVITPMVIVLGGFLFFNENLTIAKSCGGILGMIAIYLMCK